MAVADSCEQAGLKVAVIEECCPKPDEWDGDWIQGHGAIAAKGLAVALDPQTADERRMLPCRAIVIAVGRMDAELQTNHLLGITKLGASFSADRSQIITDESGRTGAPGVFAAGSCASSATPNIIHEVIQYCKTAPVTNETAQV